MKNLVNQFIDFTSERNFRIEERSNLITPFFKGEFNLSGAHEHLVPAIRSDQKTKRDSISVVDLCVRKVDSEIIGYSNSHLLLFEMGVFGQFGFIEDKKDVELEQLKYLLELLELYTIDRKDLFFTICAGGEYINKIIPFDQQTHDILINLGISASQITSTNGRRNFMLSRGIDRLAGYNVEIFVKKNNAFLEIASMNIYRYLNKISHLKDTINSGIGCGVGFDRISYYNSGKNSVYELEPFASVIDKVKKKYGSISVSIIEDKVVRLVELLKSLLYILNDGQKFDKTPQGKIITSYIARIASELFYLDFDIEWFFKIATESITNNYARYSCSEAAKIELYERITERVKRIKNIDLKE